MLLSPTWVCQKGLVASSSALFVFLFFVHCVVICVKLLVPQLQRHFCHLGANRVCVFVRMFGFELHACNSKNWGHRSLMTLETICGCWWTSNLLCVRTQTHTRTQSYVCKQPPCTCFTNENLTLADVSFQEIKAVAWLPNQSSMPTVKANSKTALLW